MDQPAPPIIGASATTAAPIPTASTADLDHLRLLSIFHYIVGGLTLVAACIPIVHFTIGMMMLTRPGFFGNHPPPVPLPVIGAIFVAFAAVIIVCGCAMAICTILSGRYLQRQVHRTFSFVVAAINCISFPFGTALGVLTIIVLSRESVRALYQRRVG